MITMYDIIHNKREGKELSKDEIDFFVNGYVKDEIPDYQASALLMAIYFKGLSKKETFLLTDAMRCSGDIVDLSSIPGVKVDKHSTGGVGDKTTLIVGPLAASCGISVAKMSGRGLGFTGGTIDKLEAIPGFKTSITSQDFIKTVKTIGMSVIGQTAHIAPADKKLYALRDVTATVENIGLISGSIMSKKLAAGSDAIVLDVKCGSGAFMKDFESALILAEYMVEIGCNAGKKTAALITDMNQPLGYAVGNALEVKEAIEVLKNNGPKDLTELSLQLAAHMVYLGEKAATIEEAYQMVRNHLENGAALDKFSQFVKAQGGNNNVIDDYSILPAASFKLPVKAFQDGFIEKIHAESIGKAALLTGAGRKKKEDYIDLSAGIILNKKIGEKVSKGDILAEIHGNNLDSINEAEMIVKDAYSISHIKPMVEKLVKALVTINNVKIY